MKPKSKKPSKPKQPKGKVYWGFINSKNPYGIVGYKYKTHAENYLKLSNQICKTEKYKLVKLIMVEV